MLLGCGRECQRADRREGRTSGQRQQGDYLWWMLLAWQPKRQQREKDKEEVRIGPETGVGRGQPRRTGAGHSGSERLLSAFTPASVPSRLTPNPDLTTDDTSKDSHRSEPTSSIL